MLKKITILKQKKPKNFSESCNIGLNKSTNQLMGIINDDIVFTNNSLDNLVNKIEDNRILGPLSNCNVGWLDTDKVYNLDGVSLIPAMKLNQIKNYDNLYKMGNNFNKYEIKERDWLAFFAVFFNKNTFKKIGLMDEEFIFDKEDLDYCIRASKLGVRHYQALDSYIFHFGGISRKSSEDNNHETHHQNALKSSQYYNEKYSKPTIVIWQGVSWKPWDDRNIELGDVGGSEIWTIHLAREIDKLGYKVYVFNDCPNASMKFGNIEYIHWKYFGEWNKRHCVDYFISSRSIEPFKNLIINAKERYLMIHDIFVMNGQNKIIEDNNQIDKFFCLSNKHKEFVSEYHNIDKDKILITSNGIDFTRFENIDETKRNRFKAIYSSSPDRGLENLLNMLPKIKEQIPEFDLHVYYGFDFFSKDKQQWVDYMLNRMKELGVVYHGKVNQEELAEAFKTARVLTYPTWMWETFCITALEAMASGSIVLSSKLWGLIDTVQDAGILLDMKDDLFCKTNDYHEKFINELYRLMYDDKYFNNIQQKGFERAKKFKWEYIAYQFDNYFKNKKWINIQ